MGQLNKATQQNSSASEELAATSEELSGQAQQLQQSVGFFKTGEGPLKIAPRSRPANSERRLPASRLAALSETKNSGNFKPC